MSKQIGKTTTPTTPTFGFFFFLNKIVGLLVTMPEDGWITDVQFWAAGASSLKIHGVVWNSSGTVLAFGPGVTTSGGSGSGTGATQFWKDTLSAPLFVASGTQVYIGWQPDNTTTNVGWAFNGNDHSPNAEWEPGGGTTGQSFASHVTESPNGAVAVFADYDPGSIQVNTGTPGSPVWTPKVLTINTGTPASPVQTPAELFVNTGTPGSPVWTPTTT